jgi:hypothetical protein
MGVRGQGISRFYWTSTWVSNSIETRKMSSISSHNFLCYWTTCWAMLDNVSLSLGLLKIVMVQHPCNIVRSRQETKCPTVVKRTIKTYHIFGRSSHFPITWRLSLKARAFVHTSAGIIETWSLISTQMSNW